MLALNIVAVYQCKDGFFQIRFGCGCALHGYMPSLHSDNEHCTEDHDLVPCAAGMNLAFSIV